MKSGDASLHIIAKQRKLLPAADLDKALAEADELGVPLEQVLKRKGVAAAEVDASIKIRARHGFPCQKCNVATFLLPGEDRLTKPCERCGGSLAPLAEVAPLDAPQAPAPAPVPAPVPVKRAPSFAPPPTPRPIAPPRPSTGIEVPAWAWTILLLVAIWFIEEKGPFSSSFSSDPPTTEIELPQWELDGNTQVGISLDPSPPRAVKTTIEVLIHRESEGPFEGEVSYRIKRDRGEGPWLSLKADEEGPIHQAQKSMLVFDGERTLDAGPCHFQFKIRPESGSERVFDWNCFVLDASGRPPSRGLPGWARWAIVCVISLYLGAPVIVKITSTHPASPRLNPVEPDLLPPAVELYLSTQTELLEELGFERVAILEFPTGKNTFYLSRLIDRLHGDTALVSALQSSSGKVLVKSTGFTSRFSNGAYAETTNSPLYSEVFPRPASKRVANVREEDLALLLRIHAGVAGEVGRAAKKVLPEPGGEIEQLARGIVEPLEYAASQGYFSLDRGVYRTTFLGAFLMTWRMLPPLRQIALLRRSSEETRLRNAYGR